MKIEFVGGARTVTGSSYILKNSRFTLMVDCGMFQGREELRRRNSLDLDYSPADIDVLLLTHAHIDHSGLIPKLVRKGFKGQIFATKATVDLCTVMLPDSAHIQENDVKWINRKNKKLCKPLTEPIYTVADAEAAVKQMVPVSYGETIQILPDVKVRFRDAGHILGSAFIEVWVHDDDGRDKKIVFSGDIGPKGQAIIRDPEVIEDADYLLIESTYGNRLHKSREDTYSEFLDIIKSSVSREGNIIIPAFAIERTQEIIFTLSKMINGGDIQPFPVFIDSPLAVSATEIFRRNHECFDRETDTMLAYGQSPFDFQGLSMIRSTDESKMLNKDAHGSMIISASGMCNAGRVKFHLQENLPDPNAAVIFVGYQAEGTPGRRLIDGADRIRLFGQDVEVRAKIHTLGGFSAHADRKGLQEWVGGIMNPELKVFVVHGEEESSISFAQLIKDEFHLETYVPHWGETIDLNTMKSTFASFDIPAEQTNVSIEEDIDRLIKSLEALKTVRNGKLRDPAAIKESLKDIRASISFIRDVM